MVGFILGVPSSPMPSDAISVVGRLCVVILVTRHVSKISLLKEIALMAVLTWRAMFGSGQEVIGRTILTMQQMDVKIYRLMITPVEWFVVGLLTTMLGIFVVHLEMRPDQVFMPIILVFGLLFPHWLLKFELFLIGTQ
jgi:hypothetical protein